MASQFGTSNLAVEAIMERLAVKGSCSDEKVRLGET